MSRQSIIAQAQSWIGCKENDGSHKKIIDVYNSIRPLPRGYKVSYTDAWCASFVSACAKATGQTDVVFPECGCDPMIKLYQSAGRWQENEDYVPKPGDIIFYDWQDNGVGDNKGSADHVGIVESVDGSTMTIIEGNISNSVGRRTLKVNGKYIRGFGLPNYSETPNSSKEPVATTVNTCTVTLPVLRKGCTGESVKSLQQLLIAKGYSCGPCKADGDFGSSTLSALESFQAENGLVVDGTCGPATWAKLIT